MKKLLVISILLGSIAGFAQGTSAKVEKAHKKHAGFDFPEAIRLYEESEDQSLETRRNLANSYWKLNKDQKAEELYALVVTMEGHTAQDLYDYAQVLRENKKYDESEKWMTKFAEKSPDDKRAIEFKALAGSYKEIQKDKGQFGVKHLDFNTEAQDFGTSFYGYKMVFASSREKHGAVMRRYAGTSLPFLDIYVVNANGTDISPPELLNKNLNKRYHDGPVAFNQEGDFMVFTRNNYDSRSEDGKTLLQLYSARKVKGKWKTEEALPFNSNEYSVGHASISEDGKWMFFASNMPGGKGGVDLYKVEIKEDGSYGEPINLGDAVNTEGDELFPNIHSSGKILFFASTGKYGLGGMDVFYVQMHENKVREGVEAKNVGAPINGSGDDFAFILDKDMKGGYFSSNRAGGKGSDDIYYYDLLKPFDLGKTIKGIATNKEGEILAGVLVDLTDDQGNKIGSITTNGDGSFNFPVKSDQNFVLKGTKEDYYDKTKEVSSATEESDIVVDLVMDLDPGLSIYATVTDHKTGDPLEDVHLRIVDTETGEEETIKTPFTGDYLRLLEGKKLGDKIKWEIHMEKEGYLAQSIDYEKIFDVSGQHDINLTLEPIEVGNDLAEIIDIAPIFFDKNKFDIRPDAAIELDKIVAVMKENSEMVIELGSHTDFRGSAGLNEKLSDNRAKASAQYIAERIDNPERIYGKGYGESKPATITLEDGTEQVLTEKYVAPFRTRDNKRYEELQQMNRRTEFIIIKM